MRAGDGREGRGWEERWDPRPRPATARYLPGILLWGSMPAGKLVFSGMEWL